MARIGTLGSTAAMSAQRPRFVSQLGAGHSRHQVVGDDDGDEMRKPDAARPQLEPAYLIFRRRNGMTPVGVSPP